VTWLHPELAAWIAAGLGATSAMAAIAWLAARRRARRLLGVRTTPPARALRRDAALVAALAAIGVASLGPEIGTRVVRAPGAGADVVLLVDVSRSMEAADVPPSRLVRARDAATALVARLEPDDRVALAVFGDGAALLAPLTPDAGAVAELVAALDGDLVVPRGSDLGAGVRAALGAFDLASERPRVVVALGDGEDADARDSAIAEARRARARVIAVAFGTEQGAPVPDGDGPLTDARGAPITSRRDIARLAALAEATDGALLRTDRWGDVDVAALAAAVRRDAARASGGVVERRVPAVWVAPFVALAIALLAGEALGGLRALRLRRRAAAVATAGVLAFASLAAATAPDDAIARLEARLRRAPGDAQALVALGVARAEAGRLDEATRALRAAAVGARDRADAALAWFDLGVAELRRERPEAARNAFLEALALAPDDREARFNLEWTLRALAARPPEASGRSADDRSSEEGERPDPDEAGADLGKRNADVEAPSPTTPPPDAARRFAPELSPDRVAQWLEAVGDDPARGLRGAAGDVPRTRQPRW
jgi:Ca-activated chloride channel family protein